MKSIEIRPLLTIVTGPGAGMAFALSGSPVIVGRGAGCDIRLEGDSAVSDRHARLNRDQAGWIVADLGSKNGTFVERKDKRFQVRGATQLDPGDRVVIGHTVLSLAFPAEPTVTSPSSPSESCPLPPDTDVAPGNAARSRTKPGVHAVVPRKQRAAQTFGAPWPPTHYLRIEYSGENLCFEALSNGASCNRYTLPFAEADAAAVTAHVRDAALLAQCAMPQPLDASQAGAALQRVGEFISAHLLPPEVKSMLEQSECSGLFLRLDRKLIHIPWELAKIGGTALCLRFGVGRQVLLDDMPTPYGANRTERSPRVLIVCNPTGDLPGVARDAQELFEWFRDTAPNLAVEFLSGDRVERFPLLERINRSDIVYFVGHATHDGRNPMNSGWPLAVGHVTCADFRSLSTPPRFVFANGCDTGREAEWSTTGLSNGAVYGIASGFIMSGVGSYLGTAWPIAPEPGTLFAKTLFEHLIAQQPLGECVRLARLEALRGYGSGNPVWASYQLYGDPIGMPI